jgi:imidazolonepropionase-like amidohydrolase
MRAKVKMQNTKLTVLFALSLLFGSFGVNAQSDGSEQNKTGTPGTFAIVGAKIVTVTGGVIDNGTILIRDGKIAAIGTNVSVPAGAERIDGKGLSVYPGMIDAATNMGLTEIAQGANATVDVSEVGNMNPNARAIKGINPHTSHINVTRVNGITTVLSHPTGGLISGQSAIINLNGSTQDEMAVVADNALVINFPRVATGGGFGGFAFAQGPPPADVNEAVRRRDQQVEELKKIFSEAEAYLKAREARRKDPDLPIVPVDLKLEAMGPYLRGERPVLLLAQRERDIRAAVKFAADMKLKAIIVGGQDAWKVADDLKKNNIAVIYTNIYALPVQQDDPYDYLFEAPSKMQQAGVKFAISTGNDGSEARDLPYHAGLAGAFGLSKEEALKSVTIYPAEILGIADRMGSLEVGKVANVVVTDGDLLDPRTNVKYVFINGRKLPLTSRHTQLFDSFKDRK